MKRQRIVDVPIPIETARRLARLLLVDDEEDALPLDLLRDEGFHLDHWQELSSDGMHRIESGEFDIVILDILGISPPNVSKSDGLGVLKHLKRVRPEQVIIAFSGQRFDIKEAGFFHEADDTLMKPTDVITACQKFDDLLKRHFTIGHYWQTIRSSLERAGTRPRTIRSLERKLASAIEKRSESDARTAVSRLVRGTELVAQISMLAVRAVELYIRASSGG